MHVLRRGSSALAWLLALALGAGAAAPAGAAEVTVTDAGGRSVRITDASRILSIGGDVTEIIYGLGAGARIVGVDSTSQFPHEALETKRNVGYMRALSSEGVISVDATLVLASERAGPPEVVKSLKTTSVPYVEVPDQLSPEGIAGKVRFIAHAIGAEAEGETIVRQVEADFAALARQTTRIKRPLRALFVLIVQNGRAIVGGQNTSADAILKLAGAQNAATGVNGFRPVPNEALVELAPDVVVTMHRSGSNAPDAGQQLATLKGLESTPAGLNRRFLVMDGLYLLGFGPRAPAAARDLLRSFYPELDDANAGAPK